jgi:hypothetical protein
METIASKDPRTHTANVRNKFRELIDHLRGDIKKIDEPKAQALFENDRRNDKWPGYRVQTLRREERECLEIAVRAALARPCAFSRPSGPSDIGSHEVTKSRSDELTCEEQAFDEEAGTDVRSTRRGWLRRCRRRVRRQEERAQMSAGCCGLRRTG